MNFPDILLGIVLVYGIIRGLWNGFFVELASLLSLIIGIFVAIRFSHLVAAMLSGSAEESSQSVKILAFAITFIAVVVAISLLAKVFTKLANFSGLAIFNTIFGGVFGFLKMVLVLSVFLNLFAKLNSGNGLASEKTLANSALYNPVRKTALWIYPSLEKWFPEVKETLAI